MVLLLSRCNICCTQRQAHRLPLLSSHAAPHTLQHGAGSSCSPSHKLPGRHHVTSTRLASHAATATTALAPAHATAPSPIQTQAPPVFWVHCVKDQPRHDMPLLLGSLSSVWRAAVACTLGDGRVFLLTTASAVSHSTQIEVHKAGEDKAYKARVLHMNLDLELAALCIREEPQQLPTAGTGQAGSRRFSRRLGDRRASASVVAGADEDEGEEGQGGEGEEEEVSAHDRFWQGVQPLVLGDLPQLQQPVQVLLQPVRQSAHAEGSTSDSDSQAYTDSATAPEASSSGRPGVVSSIEAVPYPSSLQALVAIVISAKLRANTSLGAPVVTAGGSLAGMVVRRIAPRRRGGSGASGPAGGGAGGGPGAHGGGVGGGSGHGRRRKGRLSAGQKAQGREAERAVAVPATLIRRFLEGLTPADASVSVAPDATQAATASLPSPAPHESVGRATGGADLSSPPVQGASSDALGLPGLNLKVKTLMAEPLRRSLGMSEQQQGVLVLAVNPCSVAGQVLREGDVLMQIDGLPLRNDGMVPLRTDEYIPFTAYVAQLPTGSEVQLTVLRDRQQLSVSLRLDVPPRLLPTHLGGRRPPYIVAGGLVLARCCVPYLVDAFGPQWPKIAPIKLLDKLQDFPTRPDEEVVVIAECQPLRSVEGYPASIVQHRVLAAVNGERVINMQHAAKLIFGCQSEFLRLDLDNQVVVVMLTTQAQADTKLMLRDYEVKLPVSDDLAHLLPSSAPKPKRQQALRLGARRSR